MSAGRQPKKLVAWRLTEYAIQAIQEMAAERGISQSAVIEILVREELQRREEQQLKLAA